MKVAFVYAEMETLGIQYLSSVLKDHGHAGRLFFDPQLFSDTVSKSSRLSKVFDYTAKLIESIIEYRPDLIAFSVLTTNYQWACRLAAQIRQGLATPIVFGGIHPTSLPQEVIRKKFVDFVIVGEGEYALLELVESKFRPEEFFRIKNLYFKHNGKIFGNNLREPIANLDQLPFPDKDLFYEHLPYLQKSYTIVTGRGCPHKCTYCCNGYLSDLYHNRYLRRRSPENVILELQQAVRRYKIKHIFFDDSTFTYDRQWLRAFVEEYQKKINLISFCWVYPTDVDDELINLLRTMNCQAVEMGVEHLDNNLRSRLFHRFYRNIDIEKAIALFNKNRIFCVVDNIKGFSADYQEEMKEIIRFYNKNRPNKIYLFEHRPFPKTAIAKMIPAVNDTCAGGGLLPFTISTVATSKRVRQLEMLLVLTYFLPPFLINFLLNKRVYRIFPSLSSYNMLEILPYFINLFKRRNHRFWYPLRGTRRRYFYYFFLNPAYFIKRSLRLWALK